MPVGQYKAFGAYRKDRLEGWLPGPVAGGVEHQQEELSKGPSATPRMTAIAVIAR